jgi:hypothetical protein
MRTLRIVSLCLLSLALAGCGSIPASRQTPVVQGAAGQGMSGHHELVPEYADGTTWILSWQPEDAQ